MSKINNLLKTIHHLRTYEELILFTDKYDISASDEREAISFLEEEYNNESLHYPYNAPAFHKTAALWSAKLLYNVAFFFLCRNDNTSKLISVLKPYQTLPNPSEHLSADLLMRFIPDIYSQLKSIDAQDTILPVLESHMQMFHYSSVGTDILVDEVDVTELFTDPCFRQLYVDRVTHKKVQKLIAIQQIKGVIKENLGDYTKTFWQGFQ